MRLCVIRTWGTPWSCPWSYLVPSQLVQYAARGLGINREPCNRCPSFIRQHGGDLYLKQGTKPTQIKWFLTVSHTCASKRMMCHKPAQRVQYVIQSSGNRAERNRGCRGARSLYLLVSVKLRGQLVSPPRRVLGTELQAAERPWGEQTRGVSPLASSLAQPTPTAGPRPGPTTPPTAVVGAHLPGGRASRRPWPCCCDGSAAQTAAQVSLETPAGADQGQAQPDPPAKSGSAHGRPVLCGDKGLWWWGARWTVPVPAPGPRRAPRGGGVSLAWVPPHPGEKHPSAAGWSLLRGEAFPPPPVPARVCSRTCRRGAPARRRLPPWELPALTRLPAPHPARWHRTALPPRWAAPSRRGPPQRRGSERRYASKAAEFPAIPWEILRSWASLRVKGGPRLPLPCLFLPPSGLIRF